MLLLCHAVSLLCRATLLLPHADTGANSATSEEMSPYPEDVAKALGANLFRQRMSGHGLVRGSVPGHDSGAALRKHGDKPSPCE